ncbi:TetR family transcriptional regulator protein [Chondrocystis sp. NIES-4102]|nr:TetR family transcriptional regulator protein [Chondrocystis sp. NIES-4102]
MSNPRKSTKARLIEAALDLFAERGVTETTTKAVAERAQVNEVTLFRNFGNKYRLLLAVLEDSAVFAKLVHSLVEKANSRGNVADFLEEYIQECLRTLNKAPDLVRSIVGEAKNYPQENRLALGKGLSQANRYVANYLEEVIVAQNLETDLTCEQIVNLLNFLLLGYFIIESTTEGATFWDEEDDFLTSVVQLFLKGALTGSDTPDLNLISNVAPQVPTITDLPASLVKSLFRIAKKAGKQEYALVYVLFGAGLTPEEILHLERSHSVVEPNQHILQINYGIKRQVPLNQWVMGLRYGSNTINPLIQWLRSRKDEPTAAIFIGEGNKPLTPEELAAIWHRLTCNLITPQGTQPTIEQARQTWCIEMIIRGIALEDLSIISGMEIKQLQQYAQRARNKAALEAAARLDQKKS